MTDFFDMYSDELRAFFSDMGESAYRGTQVYRRLLEGETDFALMTNLPLGLRQRLAEMKAAGEIELSELSLLKKQTSGDGTIKFLFGLPGGGAVESVFMKYSYGNSLCVSTQLGCNMACAFCASGIGGKKRNLSGGEILAQLIFAQKYSGQKVSRVVLMGTGEPFDNYEACSRFLKLANQPEGVGLGMRSMTVSTCGIVPKIADFAKDFPEVNLAVSLHAPNDVLRNRLMPVNRRFPLGELIPACRDYVKKTHRRISFEYAMIKGVNDGADCADELSRLLRGLNCHVNLIALNRVSESGFSGSDEKRRSAFKKRLEDKGIVVTARRELGSDIDAACGQLRRRMTEV